MTRTSVPDRRQAGTANKMFPEMGGTALSDRPGEHRQRKPRPDSPREGAAAFPALPAPSARGSGCPGAAGGQGAARSVK